MEAKFNRAYAREYKIIRGRRSTRYFDKDRNVSNWEVILILESARWAPSARNLQPYEFIVIRSKRKREKLAKIARQPQPKTAPVSVIVLGDVERAGRIGEISPHDVTTKRKGERMFIYMDAAAAIQNMLLAAHSLGIGSLWVSAFDEEELVRLLEVPDNYRPLAIVCLGHELRTPVVPPKRKLGEILHWERFKRREPDSSLFDFARRINEEFKEYLRDGEITVSSARKKKSA